MENVPVGIRAGIQRLGPLAAGPVAGLIALAVAPSSAGDSYFAAAAQIIPVLLLALTLEAGLFGGPIRRQPEPRGSVVKLGVSRKVLEFVTVLVLIAAEWQAIHALASPSTCDPALSYVGMVWGVVTVALLAAFRGRPRVTASIASRPHGARWIIELGMSNVYGDKDVEPLMNFIVPCDHEIFRCDSSGKILTLGETARLLPTPEKIADDPRDWCYTEGERVLLTAGDAAVVHYSVGFFPGNAEAPPARIPVVLRLDHAELSNGRVQLPAWLDPERPNRVTTPGAN